MDTPGHSLDLIDDNLNDLRRVNWLLGGRRLTRLPLARLATRVPVSTRLLVLDVASGAADIPLALSRWAARAGRPALFVASDIGVDIVRVARAHQPVPPNVVFVAADATRLPFRTGAFHVTTCSLALHHMAPDDAVRMLREMRRCARLGVIVNDIVRSWLTYYGAVVASYLGSTNPLTRHDGPVSALRAFTPGEMRALAREAGLRPLEWESVLFYRVAMTAVPVEG